MKPPPLNHCDASYAEYWTELSPDIASLYVLLAVATVAALIGTMLLLSADLKAGWRVMFCCGWLSYCACGVWKHIRDQARISRVRVFAGGAVRLRLVRGGWVEGRLQAGTLSLRSAAWLKIRTEEARSLDLIFLAWRQNAHHWRRFQVIYRHIGPHS